MILMLDKHIALLDEDVSRGQKSAKYRIFPQEVVRNRTPVPPKLWPLRCQTCHEWPLRSLLWLFPGAGTKPKVKLHFGSALRGANLSTWWTNDMRPNGTRLPATQRVARDARPTGEKKDFETEGLPSLLLNVEWDLRLSGCH